MNNYLWLIRREFWERRTFWMLPAIVSLCVIALVLLGQTDNFKLDNDADSRQFGGIYFTAIGALFYIIMAVCASLYLLDCLYDDRRDRSILFWKSLPISDTATVVSKLVVGVLVIPLTALVAADITALITATIISFRWRSMVGSAMWQPQQWFQAHVLWVYFIFTTTIWYAPYTGWLVLVSSWAKKAPLLWSVMPFLAVFLIEHFILGTHYVFRLLVEHFAGYAPAAFRVGTAAHQQSNAWHNIDLGSLLNPGGFLANPQTWAGLLVGTAMVVAAIQIRMRRTET